MPSPASHIKTIPSVQDVTEESIHYPEDWIEPMGNWGDLCPRCGWPMDGTYKDTLCWDTFLDMLA